jgi:hypothetical protein
MKFFPLGEVQAGRQWVLLRMRSAVLQKTFATVRVDNNLRDVFVPNVPS